MAAAAGAEDKTSFSSAISANALTQEQFKALSPDAMIEIDGARMNKREFIDSRINALEQAINKIRDARANTEAKFETERKGFLDGESARVQEANKKVDAEIARLVAAEAAAHGSNWEARKNEAAALLTQAATAPIDQRSQLEKASDLLSSAGPQQYLTVSSALPNFGNLKADACPPWVITGPKGDVLLTSAIPPTAAERWTFRHFAFVP